MRRTSAGGVGESCDIAPSSSHCPRALPLVRGFDSRSNPGQLAVVAELVAALIPALDCEATIGAVVRGTRAHLALVLVVDDGSRDATADAAKAAGAEVLRQPENRGKGAALRAGLASLQRRGVTHVLTLDGDGQHPPGQVPALLAASAAEPRALVQGARQAEPGSVTRARAFGNRFANRWVEIACGARLEGRAPTRSGILA